MCTVTVRDNLRFVWAFAGLALLAAGSGQAQPPDTKVARAVFRQAVRSDTSAPLHTIRPIPPKAGELRELPRKILPHRIDATPVGDPDNVVQTTPGGASAPAALDNFEGIRNRNGVLPPDTVGDIGPNHYVQAVNLSFAVFNRSGTPLVGPANINTLWSGFGGVCETSNDGDPIALYDHLADRWLISQFALPNFPYGPFYQCIAVSQSPDPAASWYRYQFLISNSKMNDYPKIGVWADGYYMSMNQFNQGNLNWGGAGVVIFERDKMLAGQPAAMAYFDLFGTDPNLGGMLPSDLDAQAPPLGTPNYFAQIDDNAWGYSPDQIQIWGASVDWTRKQATFTRLAALPTAPFDSNLCNYSRNCIPQPGGRKLDALSDRLMYRLQYRYFGSYQTLVTNHTVDVGSDHAGIRWYELRAAGSGWGIRQQGTYAPDSENRWMGSIAMDGDGNIALGYSVSSAAVSPSIRYTGRLASDPLGQMTQGEGTLVAGSGYQWHSSGRWGDYSAMSVDPVDDCTFWYTQEYYTQAGSTFNPAPWQTRVGSFKMGSCGAPPPPAPDAPTLSATAVSSSQIHLAWSNVVNEDGYVIERCLAAACTFQQIAQVAADITGYDDNALSSSTTYRYRMYAFNAGGNSPYSNVAEATTLAGPSGPPAAPSGLTATAVSSPRAVDLAWTDNSPNATNPAGEDSFIIERCQVSRKSACNFSVLATVPADTTSYRDSNVARRKTYGYRVKARNAAGDSGYSNTASATTN